MGGMGGGMMFDPQRSGGARIPQYPEAGIPGNLPL